MLSGFWVQAVGTVSGIAGSVYGLRLSIPVQPQCRASSRALAIGTTCRNSNHGGPLPHIQTSISGFIMFDCRVLDNFAPMPTLGRIGSLLGT